MNVLSYLGLRKSTPLTLGLDISSTSIKLLELGYQNGVYSVESYAVLPLPTGAVVEKVVKDPEVLGNTIKNAIKKSKTNLKTAAVALSDSSVISKVVQVEKALDDKEIEMQIFSEADKHFPYPIEEVNLDFSVIQESAQNASLLDVLLVASRSEHIETRLEAARIAGITLNIVDVESYALERACSLVTHRMPSQGIGETILVVDIGSIMTSLTVLHNLSTVFTREEVFGGEQLTRAIQLRYGLPYEKAGYAKKFGGLPEDYEQEVLEPFKESAVHQVRRALQFFYSSTQHNSISHILLAGGSVSLPNLDKLIEEKLGIPTTIVNPFAEMRISSRVDKEAVMRDASASMICCGLAMRSFS